MLSTAILLSMVAGACGSKATEPPTSKPGGPADPSAGDRTAGTGGTAGANGGPSGGPSGSEPRGGDGTSGGGTSGGGTSGGGTSGGGPPAREGDTKLRVTGLEPANGDTEGGTYVVIKGSRFLKDGPRALKVYFGSRQASVVRFQSDSEVIVQAPGGKENEVVDVLVVFDPGGQMMLPKAFTFVERGDNPSVDHLSK